MTFVELENGDWINPDSVELMYKPTSEAVLWKATMDHVEPETITDADRVRILKTAGFVPIKKEKDDE
ncbi:hypothetical protein [Lacticaseibacillus paracasei]|jgi:hypothetical protein|uniref:hypothetical protein n=1 Tax=Lacticaseibacillus paracasei TaxID=1597 RepID=UPI00058273ED|nr:hypothetical protein [Lacticaseibacillus paracasei]RUS38512.1 hypothetical protein IJ11_0011605 [Lacticaseibacillus paracasei]